MHEACRKFFCVRFLFMWWDGFTIAWKWNVMQRLALLALYQSLRIYLLCIVASIEYCMRSKRKFDFDSTKAQTLVLHIQREHTTTRCIPLHAYVFYMQNCIPSLPSEISIRTIAFLWMKKLHPKAHWKLPKTIHNQIAQNEKFVYVSSVCPL